MARSDRTEAFTGIVAGGLAGLLAPAVYVRFRVPPCRCHPASDAMPMGVPEEMVGPTIFLASPASSLVTGQLLTVDGGYTIV